MYLLQVIMWQGRCSQKMLLKHYIYVFTTSNYVAMQLCTENASKTLYIYLLQVIMWQCSCAQKVLLKQYMYLLQVIMSQCGCAQKVLADYICVYMCVYIIYNELRSKHLYDSRYREIRKHNRF